MTRSSSLSPPRSLFASPLPLFDLTHPTFQWSMAMKYSASQKYGSFQFTSCSCSHLSLANITDYFVCNLAENKFQLSGIPKPATLLLSHLARNLHREQKRNEPHCHLCCLSYTTERDFLCIMNSLCNCLARRGHSHLSHCPFLCASAAGMHRRVSLGPSDRPLQR